MKQNLFKTLLLAATLLVGGANCAWAEDAFVQNFTGSSTDPVDYGFAVTTIESGTATVGDGKLTLCSVANSNKDVSAAVTATFSAIGTGNIVTFSCAWNPGGPTGTRSTSNLVLQDGSGTAAMTLTNDGQAKKLYLNGNEIASGDDWRSYAIVWNVVATLNVTSNKILTLTVTKSGQSTPSVSISNIAFQNTVTSISKFYCQTTKKANWVVTSTLDDVSITYVSTPTATVTYEYEDESGNDITALAISKGATASATAEQDNLFTPEYPSSFVDNEYAYDYEYTSGGDAFTVEDDVTITLVYTKSAHPTTDVTVQYKSGGVTVKEEVVAEDYPVGKSISYGVHQYLIGNDGMFYQTAQGATDWYYRSAAAAASLTENVTLSGINNVVFFTEAEDISGYTAYSKNSNRASNGDIANSGGDYRNLTTLAPGKYRVYTRSIRSNKDTHALNIKCGESVVGEFNVENGTNVWKNTEEFTVSTTSVLSVASGGSSQAGLDFIYVVKTGEAVTLGELRWATLYTPYALNFAGTGLTAYTASLSEGIVTLTPVTDVPANTGVVLNGAAGSYNIPTTASSETPQGDLTGNATEATAIEGGHTYYVLAQAEDYPIHKVQFRPVTDGPIAAGKAFLDIAGAGVKAFNIDIAGADAIDDVRSKMEEGRSEIFNLAGQRMNRLQKGVNIVNGKKILVK